MMSGDEVEEVVRGLADDAREILRGAIDNDVWVRGTPQLIELGLFEWKVNPWSQRYSSITDLGRQVAERLSRA